MDTRLIVEAMSIAESAFQIDTLELLNGAAYLLLKILK